LGLATVYGTVTNHNGYIKVDSILGKRTVFSIYLPVSVKMPEKPVEYGEIQSGRGLILVVDDENDVRKLASNMLEEIGYTVLTADNRCSHTRYYYA